jgi:protein gp37
MSEKTKIEWTDHTFNPWIGCTKVSPACDHCYAEVSTPSRTMGVAWGAGQPRRITSESNWKEPIKWNKRKFYQCACGWRGHEVNTEGTSLTEGLPSCPECDSMDLQDTRQRVFCASLADVFDNEAPLGARELLFQLIELTPNLDWLLLTKRIGNVPSMIPARWAPSFPSNVWLGISVVNQQEADRDIPKLLRVPATVRFLSMEPLLGPVDLRYLQPGDPPTEINALAGTHGVLRPHRGECAKVDWVIVGGESGPNARPMHPDWVRSLRDQCAAAGVSFLYKQWGEWISADQDECPTGPSWRWMWSDGKEYERNVWRTDAQLMCRAGKANAGRLLDGRTHDEFPKGAA